MNAKSITIEIVNEEGIRRSLGLTFSSHPPELHQFMLLELFRSALRALR